MVNSLQAPTVIVRHSLPQHSASSLFSVIAPFLNKNLRASLNSTALVQVNQFLLCHLLIYILSRTFQKPFHPSTFPSVCISAAPEHNSRQWTVDVCVLLKNWRTISAGDSTGYALALQVKTILLQTLGCTLASQLWQTWVQTLSDRTSSVFVRPATPMLLVSSIDRPIRCGRVPRSPNCQTVSSSHVSVQRDVLNMNAGRNKDERRQAFSICQ